MNKVKYLIIIKSGWRSEYIFETANSEEAMTLAKNLLNMHVDNAYGDEDEHIEFDVVIKLINDGVVDLSESEDNF